MKKAIQSAAVVALMALGAVSAQAQVQSQEAGFAPEITNAKSQLSRQQVINAYQTARQNGSLPMVGDTYTTAGEAKSVSTLTRAEVRAEAIAANKSGRILEGEGGVQ